MPAEFMLTNGPGPIVDKPLYLMEHGENGRVYLGVFDGHELPW